MRRAVPFAAAALAMLTPFGVAVTTAVPAAHAAPLPVYLDRSYSPAERAADLVSRMTLQEKASELNSSQAAAIPRLGVAEYAWWNEAAHGVAREGTKNNANPPILTNTTSYPVDLSAGSTWNPDLLYREATLISDEAREVVRQNKLDLNFYSPTVNLGRDPRWGRNDETFSEDPTLTAAMASQYVDGMEGKDSSGRMLPSSDGYLKTMTTIKHFAANNSEYNRLNGSSDMDERTLREYYTAQFRDIIEAAGPASIMSSYNEINGTPSPANVHLIDTLARQTFGFGGYFTSDCDAVFIMQAAHHWTPPNSTKPVDPYTRTAYANSAGEDLDCQQGYHDAYSYANTIPQAIAQHVQTLTDTYNENDVDVSVARLFTARIASGEFDAEASVPWVRQARARIAPGSWTNDDSNGAVTETAERLAMARQVADQSIVMLKNAAPAGEKSSLLPLKVPSTGSFKVAVIGTFANPDAVYLGGYSSNQGPSGVAKEVNGYQGLKAAIEARNPDATVDYLPGTTDNATKVDAASVAAAKGYDAVVVYVGTDNKVADEGKDRPSLALPGAQAELVKEVAAANPRTIAYLETIGEVDVNSFAGQVPAMLWSSYNGQRKGEALADVVLGKVSPSGHLPFTWYGDESQLPAMGDYAIRPTSTTAGRTYMYFTGKVAYPFGYGLSYTDFQVGGMTVDRHGVDANGDVTVTAQVTNTGQVAGSQVVQLYVATPDSPAALQRPVKRLVGFAKVSLQPGETTAVHLTVRVPDLAFWDEQTSTWTVDKGAYVLSLGTSSADADVQQQVRVQVGGELAPTPQVLTAKPVAAGDAADDVQQRLLFPAGTTVDPQLTVSVRDASLYGYVTKGQSRPLPHGAKVSFSSNRPDVVSVQGGTVRTEQAGVATVTATLTYRGVSATTSFVVDVR